MQTVSKVVLWVLVEQLKDTDRTEGCIMGSGRTTEECRLYRVVLWVLVEQLKDANCTEGFIVFSGKATEGYRLYKRLYCWFW